jgi:tRNA G18 (ribose-2'-O)-methylase SpoU
MNQIIKKTTEELVAAGASRAEQPRTPISIIADNIRSLDNIGLLFRTCELIRAEKLYLTGHTGYPRQENDSRPKAIAAKHQRRIAKTAVYALPHQPWEYHEDPLPLAEQLKKEGYTIVVLEQTNKSVPYHAAGAAAYSLPLALVLGHERRGVRQELVELADTVIEIPILGIGNSHNVAVSASMVLYKILEKNNLI